MGKHAICCVGGANHLISGNDISHTAYGGVMLKDCGNTKVSGNHIRHSGEVYKHHAGIALEGPKALANTVLGNAIHDMTRYGISLKNPGVSKAVPRTRGA